MQELPTKLSPQGIRQFVQPKSLYDNDKLILQVTKISQDCQSNKICILSDGYTQIKGWLDQTAKLKAYKGELLVYNVIRVSKKDYEFLGADKDPAFKLNDCVVINSLIMLNIIGQPLSYLAYYHNNFKNNRGSNQISTGQKPTSSTSIKSLTESYPHVPNKWIIRARIVKKPDNINPDKPFMIIKIMDQTTQTIQCVFFGKIALEYCQRLKYNHQYLFSNGQIKMKRQGNQQFEIKFNQGSQILPVDKQSNFTLNSNNFNKAQSGQKQGTTARQIYSKDQQGQIVTIIGKVNRIRMMSKGRSLELIDRSFQSIQVVLWEEFRDDIRVGQTYKFQNVRTKKFNSTISLQSVRNKTVVSKSDIQIFQQASNAERTSQSHRPIERQNGITKQLKDYRKLLNVTELLDLQVQNRMYLDVNGFLVIHTVYLQPKNYFRVQCLKCQNRQLNLTFEDKVQCRKCSATDKDISLRWNIRCHIIDDKQDIKCVMNQQISQKLLKISALAGFVLLQKQPQVFKKRITQISHLQGIFRMKLNPYNGSVYYNIVDMYKNDSNILLMKQYKQLKMAISKYLKQTTSNSHSKQNSYNIETKQMDQNTKQKQKVKEWNQQNMQQIN